MAKITEEMKAMIANQSAFIATTNADSTPNLVTKGTTQVLNDEHIVFFELIGGRTWENLQKNPAVAIGVADKSTMQGYRFVGKAEFIIEGDLYESAKKIAEMLHIPAPPKAAVKVKVDAIYNLGAGGQMIE